MSARQRTMYRFGFYGRSGFGKTCILALLEKAAEQNPDGITCRRLPVTVPKPKAANNAKTREALALHEGQEWLQVAQDALQKGTLPPPNRPSDLPFIVDFEIGTRHRGLFHVRFIDYAGETIDPGGLSDPKSLSRKLEAVLAECDGLSILADTQNGPRDSTSAAEINRLAESLAALRQRRKQAVGQMHAAELVLSKWDRWAGKSTSAPRDGIQEYLRTDPPVEKLARELEHANADSEVTQSHKPVDANGRDFVFTCSAFGYATVADRPPTEATGGIQPVGLLEPVVWLADRCDEIDAQQLRDRWRRISGWRSLRWLKLGPPWRLLRDARRCSHRAPKKSAAHASFRSIARKAAGAMFVATVAWIAMLMSLGQFGLGRWWKLQFDQYAKVVEDPASNEKTLADARDWFGDYSRTVTWRGWKAPSPEEARGFIAKIDSEMDTRYWRPVENAEAGSAAQADAAKKYLDNYPNGQHAADAHRIVEAHVQSVKERNNSEWLSALRRALDAANDKTAIEDLRKSLQGGFPEPQLATPQQNAEAEKIRDDVAQKDSEIDNRDWMPVEKAEAGSAAQADAAKKYLDNYPNGRHAADARRILEVHVRSVKERDNSEWLSAQRRALDAAKDKTAFEDLRKSLQGGFPEPQLATPQQNAEAEKIRDDAARRIADLDWREFQSNYDQAMRSHDFDKAADLLVRQSPRDGRWENTVKRFPERVLENLRGANQKAIREGRYDRAYEFTTAAQRRFTDLADTLRPAHPELSNQLIGRLPELHKELSNVLTQWDQYEYQRVIANKDKKSCEQYLDHKTIPRHMEQDVRKYRDYLHSIEGKQERLSIRVQLKFGPDYDEDSKYHIVEVFVDGDRLASIDNIHGKAGLTTEFLGDCGLRNYTLNDVVTFRVKVSVDYSRPWSDRVVYDRTEEVRIDKLLSNDGYAMQPGPNLGNRAILKIVNITPPELPKWTSR